ncbi:hypothetical protein WA026_000415 [Henosepilachna vigintioctopunctata]|uniref:Uncharacterized protein n=1 Tax=Henosepilachna vigintioctopunctata TaxID=420089 RepID=A0AAW1V0E1_9CUCU
MKVLSFLCTFFMVYVTISGAIPPLQSRGSHVSVENVQLDEKANAPASPLRFRRATSSGPLVRLRRDITGILTDSADKFSTDNLFVAAKDFFREIFQITKGYVFQIFKLLISSPLFATPVMYVKKALDKLGIHIRVH